ncbi:MAG: HIT domain-containing protein [archaeon]
MDERFVFCDLMSGKKKLQSGELPFMVLKDMKHSVSFLSIDFPAYEDGHTLVIPKKHYAKIEDVPKKVLHELIEHCQIVARAIGKRHSGCNILLNDGKFADQSVFHVHFHIVPRDKKDKIVLDRWKTKKLGAVEFGKLFKKMKKVI